MNEKQREELFHTLSKMKPKEERFIEIDTRLKTVALCHNDGYNFHMESTNVDTVEIPKEVAPHFKVQMTIVREIGGQYWVDCERIRVTGTPPHESVGGATGNVRVKIPRHTSVRSCIREIERILSMYEMTSLFYIQYAFGFDLRQRNEAWEVTLHYPLRAKRCQEFYEWFKEQCTNGLEVNNGSIWSVSERLKA